MMALSDEWLAARIRELPPTPVVEGSHPMAIRDTVARKFGRDLLADNPHFDAARFLEACAFFRIGSNDKPPTLRTLWLFSY